MRADFQATERYSKLQPESGTDLLNKEPSPLSNLLWSYPVHKCLGLQSLLLVQACIDVVPKNPANFNVDNVRVVKILGGGAHDSKVVKGVVIKRSTEGSIHDVTDAKVAVFAQGVDTASTETKVTSHKPYISGLSAWPSHLQIHVSDGQSLALTGSLPCHCMNLIAHSGYCRRASLVGLLLSCCY